jgi:hypothetical protein
MFEKTTVTIALAAGALLSGVVTAETATGLVHLLFVKGGRIEVPADRNASCKSGALRSDAAFKLVRQITEVPRADDPEPTMDRQAGRPTEIAAPRIILVRGVGAAPHDTDATRGVIRQRGRRLVRSPLEA